MAVIDSNNFITHLVWSGLIDKATCGELKEAIELCTVKDIYTKADMVAMLKEIQSEIEKLNMHGFIQLQSYRQKTGRYRQGFERAQYLSTKIIQEKINALKADRSEEDGTVSN